MENRNSRPRRTLPGLLLLALGAAFGAPGQELVTDRPDQTESAVTVPAGLLQLESGCSLSAAGDGAERQRQLELLGSLLRIGLAPRWELRLGWTGWVAERTGHGTAARRSEGAGDAEIGAKVALLEERGGQTELALLVGVGLPLGATEITAQRLEPALRLALGHSLGDSWSVGVNLGAAWETAGDAARRTTVSRALYTVALGRSVGERLGLFVEAFGELGGSAGGPPAHSLDGGITWLLSPRLQIDLAGGVGVSSAADDWFVGLGVSLRRPL